MRSINGIILGVKKSVGFSMGGYPAIVWKVVVYCPQVFGEVMGVSG